MFKYVESIVGFSREAFEEAYSQGVESGVQSSEMDLTRGTHERVLELESQGNTVEMIIVGFEKTIILYDQKYEIIEMSQT